MIRYYVIVAAIILVWGLFSAFSHKTVTLDGRKWSCTSADVHGIEAVCVEYRMVKGAL